MRRSRTVTTGTGDNKRTETRYSCHLVGKGRALDAMQRWAARSTAVFGVLPGYQQLLEVWSLR